MYITEERRCSAIEGVGIQYIPGHDEKFIDYIVERYLPEAGNIVDLGGGGFRFAIPVSLTGRNVTIVDIDSDGLDLPSIVERINQNGKMFIDLKRIQNLIKINVQDIFQFLKMTPENYDLISAFRVLHFLSPIQMDEIFSLMTQKLNPEGVLAISSITLFDRSKSNDYNEFFMNSSVVDQGNFLYRKFYDNTEASRIRQKQNLPQYLHFIDNQFIGSMSSKYGLEVVESDVPSTRVVNGYVLKKGARILK